MKMQAQTTLTGVKASAGTFEGRSFDSTTFHLLMDIKETSNGVSFGQVTRDFKFGTSKEADKWIHLRNSGPVQVLCTFDAVATKDGDDLVLVDIRPLEKTKVQ